ncbi:DLW-39 family protein [Rothia uropygialis]|nr:DLW-39 family protein [Kocuria sp. 36]
MRKILAALAAGTVAFVVTKRVKDSQETKRTWSASTDKVD